MWGECRRTRLLKGAFSSGTHTKVELSMMQLSTNQPYSWTLLLLVVLNLLPWENGASAPMYDIGTSDGQASLEELFDHAIKLSQNIRELAIETRHIFLEDVQYASGRWFTDGALTSCHTTTLAVVEPEKENQQIPDLLLLKGLLSMLEPWKQPLYHIGNQLDYLKDVPSGIVSRAKELEAKVKELLETIRRILKKVRPGFGELERYPVWKGMASLQSDDDESRVFAFFDVFQCLSSDSHKVKSYLNTLKCQLVYYSNC